MKSLNSSQDYWQMDRVSTESKIGKLQEELDRVTVENNRLLERGVVSDGHKKTTWRMQKDEEAIRATAETERRGELKTTGGRSRKM